MTNITYFWTTHNNRYQVRDWFKGGQATLDAAEAAPCFSAASTILERAYLGPDPDGVEIVWASAEEGRTYLEGWAAIEFAERHNAPLRKWSDSTEDWCEGLSVEEAVDVAQIDPDLIYIPY